jgi:hypothetical protein
MSEWMQISVQLPEDEGFALLLILREKMGFTETDWCEAQREDRAWLMYGSCDPPTAPPTVPSPRPPSDGDHDR